MLAATELQTAGCPFNSTAQMRDVEQRFRPFDLADPFPLYSLARAQAPMFYSEELGYWVVTRHDDIKAVFQDWQTFSSENAQSPYKPWSAQVKAILKEGGYVGGSGLSARTPPTHTRIRRAVSSVFGIRRFAALEPVIRQRARSMIAGFAHRKQADMVADLAHELPAYTLFKLLGVPDSDVADVKRWAASRALLTWGDLSAEEQVPHAHNLVHYWRYCEALVARSHRAPGDDLPSDLVRLQQQGTDIQDVEIAGICWSMLFAGHETTTTLIANAIRELLLHGQWQALAEDPARIPNAVEEVLRFSPSIVAWRRKALADAEVAGQPIAKGAELLLVMASGNRDERKFDQPEVFDIGREEARNHTSFGYGIHFCLGAPLARLQARVVLEELTQALPGMELVPDQEFEFVPNTSFRAPIALQVHWAGEHRMSSRYAVSFAQAEAADAPRLGGKCASLARLIRAGAAVPPGFAVTTDAFTDMLDTGGLRERISLALAGVAAGDVEAQAAAARCIRDDFAQVALPLMVRAAIAQEYLALCRQEGVLDDLPVAVRSSATAEDMPDASFAGQQDTYLWVVGLEAVLQRVRDCWASLFTARAIGYRDDRRIPHMDVLMSVGIQKMVDASVAGVAMTVDPLNGDRAKMVIDASWGLGETVVSGEVTPDHFAVDKVMLTVVERVISIKEHEVVADRAGRCTVHRAVAPERRGVSCLSDQQIDTIARLAKHLERQFGGAQDIEWAIEPVHGQPEGRLMLLQCRPETVWSQKKAAPNASAAGMEGLVNALLTPVRIRPPA